MKIYYHVCIIQYKMKFQWKNPQNIHQVLAITNICFPEKKHYFLKFKPDQ